MSMLNEEAFQAFCSLDLGDGSVLRELFQLHQSSGEARFSRMQQALTHGRHETLCKEAHSLKGAVAQVGGLQLAENLHLFEQKARERRPVNELTPLLEALRQDYLALNRILSQRLQKE